MLVRIQLLIRHRHFIKTIWLVFAHYFDSSQCVAQLGHFLNPCPQSDCYQARKFSTITVSDEAIKHFYNHSVWNKAVKHRYYGVTCSYDTMPVRHFTVLWFLYADQVNHTSSSRKFSGNPFFLLFRVNCGVSQYPIFTSSLLSTNIIIVIQSCQLCACVHYGVWKMFSLLAIFQHQVMINFNKSTMTKAS